MSVAEYLNWQRFNRIEPIGITAALDIWFARLIMAIYTAAGAKGLGLDQFLTFTPHQEMTNQRILSMLQTMGFEDNKNDST